MGRVINSTEGVRIGPISLLTLISVLLMAVLAMLCVTTTNATTALADRQASSLAKTYKVDSCGQALLAGIDAQLSRSTGTSEQAVAELSANFNSLVEQAKADANAQKLTVSGAISGSILSFTIESKSGKKLEATLQITDNLSYTITSWNMTTTQKTQQETLWTGSDSN